MLGLRQRVIDAICEEEWPHPNNEVNSTTISERLKRGGVNTSKVEVEQVLSQLNEDGDIILGVDPPPGRGTGPVVDAVDQGLCP